MKWNFFKSRKKKAENLEQVSLEDFFQTLQIVVM
jgi:hypothetical protein